MQAIFYLTLIFFVEHIPKGSYTLVRHWSRKFPYIHLQLLDVPNRSGILIHAGNTPKDTSGCILLAKNFAEKQLKSVKCSLSERQAANEELKKKLNQLKNSLSLQETELKESQNSLKIVKESYQKQRKRNKILTVLEIISISILILKR